MSAAVQYFAAAVRGVASRPGLREGLTVERNRVRRARVVSGFIRGGAREQRLHHEENQVARRESGCGRRPLGRIWRGPARVPERTWSRLIVRVEGSRQKTRRATEDLGPGFLPRHNGARPRVSRSRTTPRTPEKVRSCPPPSTTATAPRRTTSATTAGSATSGSCPGATSPRSAIRKACCSRPC